MNKEVDFKKVFDSLMIHCIATGDQNLWNLLYPICIQIGYELDKNIVKYFSHKIEGSEFENNLFQKDIDFMIDRIRDEE